MLHAYTGTGSYCHLHHLSTLNPGKTTETELKLRKRLFRHRGLTLFDIYPYERGDCTYNGPLTVLGEKAPASRNTYCLSIYVEQQNIRRRAWVGWLGLSGHHECLEFLSDDAHAIFLHWVIVTYLCYISSRQASSSIVTEIYLFDIFLSIWSPLAFAVRQDCLDPLRVKRSPNSGDTSPWKEWSSCH